KVLLNHINITIIPYTTILQTINILKVGRIFMKKITFLGAGSTVFVKNLLGDSMTVPALQEFEFALFDIDPQRLKDSEIILNNIKKNLNSDIKIVKYSDRKEALRGA